MSDDENPPPKMEDQIVGPEDTTMTKQKIDLVLVRIGNSCLISSVLLFVSLIIVAAVSWRPDASSLVIGFVFSLTLFMVWLSIHGVYGSKSGGLVNAGNFQTFVPMPSNLHIRLRTDEEIKNTFSKPWLAFLGLSYLIGGVIIGTCEGYLLASGLFTDYRIGPICGVRIGLAVLFWATGISLMALNFAAKKRRRTLVVLTLVLGLASLIGAIILTTTSFQDSGLDFLRFLTSDNTYHGDYQNKMLDIMWTEPVSGLYYFPFLPWTPILVAMNSVPLYILSISIGVIAMSLNLILETSPTCRPNAVQAKQLAVSRSFSVIGICLVLVGILTSITVLTIPLLFTHWHWDLYVNIYNPVVFMTLTLTISGLLALSNSGSTWRSFGLFIMAFIILGSCILMVIQMSDEMNNSQQQQLNNAGCSYKNNTNLCVKYFNRTTYVGSHYCIPDEKVCNGILDILQITESNFEPSNEEMTDSSCYPRNSYWSDSDYDKVKLVDEEKCGHKWTGIFVVIFTLSAIGIVLALSLLALTWGSLVSVVRMIYGYIRKIFCGQILLENMH